MLALSSKVSHRRWDKHTAMIEKPAVKSGSILDRLKENGAGTGSLAQSTVSGKPVEQIIQESEAVRTGAAKPPKHYPTTDVVVRAPGTEEVDQEIVKPRKTNDKQVLFHCPHRPNVGSAMPTDGRMIRFSNGWLLTEEEDVIKFVRENLTHWHATEVK